jgi:hypothetical protein
VWRSWSCFCNRSAAEVIEMPGRAVGMKSARSGADDSPDSWTAVAA